MPSARFLALATSLLCSLAAAEEAPPAEIGRLGAVFAGGVLDLMTEPGRDVTASFAALISAPIGSPLESGAEFELLRLAIPPRARALDPELSGSSLVGLCVIPDSPAKWRVEAILQGGTHPLTMSISAASGATHPPLFMLGIISGLRETVAQRLRSERCTPVKRDAQGEVFLGQETTPVRYETTFGEPWPSGSDHLLEFAEAPDRAVAGLMPAEIFASQHRELPRPRAAGVLALISAAEALWQMGSLTLVASPPTPDGSVVFFLDGQEEAIRLGFKNGYFTPPQFVTPASAIGGPWSKWSWSLIDPRMPAEILLDMSPAAAGCLEALPKVAQPQFATQVQQCLDLSLPDAGGSFRVRRERWLEPVRAHEASAANRVESFCADQGALASVPFFQRPAGGKKRDAGPLLTAVLGWEERKGAKKVPGSLKLPVELNQKFAAAGFMELPEAALATAAGADTSFFGKLAGFDHWELTGGKGPLTPDSRLHAASAPLPQFSRLSLAARLHLRRASKSGKLVQAAAEVRSAARLSFSSETSSGQRVGLALLTIEWRAWEWAQKNQLATAGWTPIDPQTIERARRVVHAAPAFFSPMANEETFSRAVACDRVTSCAAYTEVAAVNAGLESILREPWRARYAATLATIHSPNDRCRFALARHWSTRAMIDVAEAKRSRNQEVIAGGLMSAAATGFYLPTLQQYYPR